MLQFPYIPLIGINTSEEEIEMMKNRIITCLLALLLLFSIPVQQANAALAFKDVGETYSKVINEFVNNF